MSPKSQPNTLTLQTNERALRASHLFRAFSDEQLLQLARTAARRSIGRGGIVFSAETIASHFAVIAHGLVKINQRTGEGTNAIIAIFGPHESLGQIAVLSGTIYGVDAVAASQDVEVLFVEAAPVLKARHTDPTVASSLNEVLIEHARALEQKIRIMTAGCVSKRLATLLSHLAERFGDELDEGTILIPIALSRIELSRLVGATVETTIRTMSKWQKAGLVETNPHGFIVRDLAGIAAWEDAQPPQRLHSATCSPRAQTLNRF